MIGEAFIQASVHFINNEYAYGITHVVDMGP